RQPEIVLPECFDRGDLVERPGARGEVIARHALQDGAVAVDPDAGKAGFLADAHVARRTAQHNDDVRFGAGWMLDGAEHNDAGAVVARGDLDRILAEAGYEVLVRARRYRVEKGKQQDRERPH